MIMMCQCKFIDYNKYTIQWKMLIIRKTTCLRTRGRWEISVLSAPYYNKPKTDLKNKVYLKKIRKERKVTLVSTKIFEHQYQSTCLLTTLFILSGFKNPFWIEFLEEPRQDNYTISYWDRQLDYLYLAEGMKQNKM